jgi:hypothetical protein
MSTRDPKTPRDEDIDALLARRYRDTTPQFEARWVALKRDLRQPPRSRRWIGSGWAGWPALAGAMAVAVVIAITAWRREPPPRPGVPELSPALAELFGMDEVLGRATVLLDAEYRAALLHLPAEPKPRT